MSNNSTLLMTFAANNLQGVKAEADKIWKSVKKNTTIKSKKLNDALNKIATKSDEDQIIMLKARINRLKREVEIGIMDRREMPISNSTALQVPF